MDDIDKQIADYNASRDHAIVEFIRFGNTAALERHTETYRSQYSALALAVYADPEKRKIAICKAATGITHLPADVRATAKKWLTEAGFKSWDDGEL